MNKFFEKRTSSAKQKILIIVNCRQDFEKILSSLAKLQCSTKKYVHFRENHLASQSTTSLVKCTLII